MQASGKALDPFFAALNAGDAEGVRRCLAKNFVLEEVGEPGLASIQGLSLELQLLFNAFPDLYFQVVRSTPDNGRLYVEFKATGTHRGEFLDVDATGSFANVSGVFNLEIVDATIKRLALVVDFGGLRRQLLIAAKRAEER